MFSDVFYYIFIMYFILLHGKKLFYYGIKISKLSLKNDIYGKFL